MAFSNNPKLYNRERITLDELRQFVESTALHPGDATVRVKPVPFKEMGHREGQPIRELTITVDGE